jgi:class 3 adenylate cyclase
MAFRSLRTRLLILGSTLVVALTVATLAYVSWLANTAVSGRITEDLQQSRRLVLADIGGRYRDLALVAELVASFPNLRALFATDAATIRDFLADYRQRHDRQELLLALDTRGQVVARSDRFAPLVVPDVERAWLQPALEGRRPEGVLDVDGRLHHGVAAAAESGGTIFGYVLALAPVDEAWARGLRDASGKEIVVLSATGVAASTVPTSRLPWRNAADYRPAVSIDIPQDVDLGGERFHALSVTLSPPEALTILSLQSRDVALAPYRNIQLGLLILGLVAAAVGIGGSAVLARSITAPIKQLAGATRQVAAGDFDIRLSVARRDEIGDLAQSFNAMTEGLRQRADMQKFVSQSTLEMIRKDEARTPHAGGRRVITVLFADIRGFTAFAEHRPPEEVVQMLNRYLRLQADLVKRFHGDVDKFMGDAVFAHFTGPDMALDAIRCAVEIQRAIDTAARTEPNVPALAVGIGIATGDVIVGSIGSADRLDYTAIGPAVNLGSRLCSSAEPREILLSEQTYTLVRDLVAAELKAPMSVRGFSEPVNVYRMMVQRVGPHS